MRQTLKQILPPAMTATLRRMNSWRRELSDPHATKSYSQEGEDMVLRSIFLLKRPIGFYVDVGAHHPKRFSNTYMFYKYGWQGINIEPNPDAIDLFRTQRPRDVNLSVGISDQPGELTYFMFNEPAVNTFGEAQALEVERVSDFRIVQKRTIPVRRLDEVLREHLPKGTTIDFLTVDVEGHDLAVLKSNDWSAFRPRCVVVEAYDTSLGTIAGCAVHEFLAARSYELFAKTVNTLIYLDASRGPGARID